MVELYQDYAGIQAAIDNVLRTIVVSITAALAVLYLLLVPVARLTTRTELARKRAVRENSEKSRFLAFMSHELRTPLNSILGFSQLLEAQHHGRLSRRQLRHVNNIKTSGHHLLAIINDILDLSKVEAGAMEMRLEPVDVRAVLDEVVIQLSPLAERDSISLGSSVSGDLYVMADAMRLKQVLINLASNAIKFTPAGGSVAIAAAARQGRVDVSVEDTGIGIRPEDLARLFQPFVQVDGDRTRKTGGTGLGLALSHGLVKRMGGRMEATSVPNKGSCFTVSLPSATQPAHKTVRAPVLASTPTGRR